MCKSSQKRLLFICGLPRSGTSILCKLINASKLCSIGQERYFHLATPGNPFLLKPGHFSKDRFFKVKDGDTFHDGNFYQGMAEKYEQCLYVGDKLPFLSHHISSFFDVFGGHQIRILFLLRNPFDHASSYLKRLNDPNDNWNNDLDDAASHFNKALDSVLGLDSALRESIDFLEYELFFTDPLRITSLLSSLELPLTTELQDISLSVAQKAQQLSTLRTTAELTHTLSRRICLSYDFSAYQKVIGLINS